MTVHRCSPAAEWRDVRIVHALPFGQVLVEEADQLLPGRFATFWTDLREEGGIFEYGEPFVSKERRMNP